MNLTPKQREALELIAENPGRVIAWQRGTFAKGYLKINGNIENMLIKTDLVTQVSTGTVMYSHEENGREVGVHSTTWEITDAGREVLGIKLEPKQVEKTGIETLQELLTFD